MNLSRFLYILLPTLCLVATAVSLPSRWSQKAYQEVFGNQDYYLDLRYTQDPSLSQRTINTDFVGYFVTPKGEVSIRGKRFQEGKETFYEFQTPSGKFEGKLDQVPTQCEPVLNFNLLEKESQFYAGTLKAGFCL